jgi:hypothetical protein
MTRYLILSAILVGCATTATGPRDAPPVIESVGDMRPAAPVARDDGDVFEVQLTQPRRAVHATANTAKKEIDDVPEITAKRPLL